MSWDEIRSEWETSKITLKDLAAKHDVKLGTLKSRKSREGWSRGATKKDATNSKKVATPNKKDATLSKEENEPVVESDNLTDKQRLFCMYYLKYYNATKAYQKAYGCAYSTAMVQGHRHLRNPKINVEIDRMKQEQANELKLDVRVILQKYIDIAFADITDFVTFGREEIEDDLGNPYEVNSVKFKESDEVDGTIISEISHGRNGPVVKLADKMKALEMLSKYFDLLSDNDKKRLQQEKLKADIAKVKGDDGTEYEDDGFIDAIKSTTSIWDDGDE